MILEIDAGNSRIKWRLRCGREIIDTGIGDPTDVPALLNEVAGNQSDGWPGPSRVRAASVRGDEFDHELAASLSARWGVLPEFARADSRSASVFNGYEVPTALGVDRWLAILAAFQRAQRGCCVIDAGSAITLDLVSAEGAHEGGYIVPGLRLQRRCLLDHTGVVLKATAQWADVLPGVHTQAAVDNGILSMVTGWVVFMVGSSGLAAERELYLTGGDAVVLSEQLNRHNVRHTVVADLVLEGLELSLQ